ncbi:hypothetical protein, partial [Enterococcus faecalis]
EKPEIVELELGDKPSPRSAVAAIGVAVYVGFVWQVAALVNYAIGVNLGGIANAAIGVNVWKAVNISSK